MNLDTFKKRAYCRLFKGQPDLQQLLLLSGVKEVILAGGGLLKDYNDLDLFPSPAYKNQFEAMRSQCEGSKTSNATTIKLGDKLIQFCSYSKPTLKELVESFDFSHCQVGALVDIENMLILDVYVSEHFKQSMVEEGTDFTGSAYPLSSLLRVPKVAKKLNLSSQKVKQLIFSTLEAVLMRGFSDNNDFKDQLDAIDMLYVLDKEDSPEAKTLINIFEQLKKP
jgi:hypothetical protein